MMRVDLTNEGIIHIKDCNDMIYSMSLIKLFDNYFHKLNLTAKKSTEIKDKSEQIIKILKNIIEEYE